MKTKYKRMEYALTKMLEKHPRSIDGAWIDNNKVGCMLTDKYGRYKYDLTVQYKYENDEMCVSLIIDDKDTGRLKTAVPKMHSVDEVARQLDFSIDAIEKWL